MELRLDRESGKPLYRQLVDLLIERIRSGALPPGSRLPPVRELAQDVGLTRLTVHNAYSELQATGWVEAFVGRGTFVAQRAIPPLHTTEQNQSAADELPWLSQGMMADMLRLEQRPDLISFAQAIPARETFPTRELGRALQGALRDPASLCYGPTQGEQPLRESVATLLLDRNIIVPPEQVIITTGAQQSIALALRAFVRQGDVVLVEEPTYLGFIERATAQGIRLIGVPTDEQGMRVDLLPPLLREYRPRLIYTIPTFHNPTGVSLPPERQQILLNLAREHDTLILEDDVYGPLGFDGAPPLPLKSRDSDGRIVYLGSFSKILTPGLRLGFLVANESFLGPLLAAKRVADLHCSPLLQRALADYLQRGYLHMHLRSVRALYRERRDAMDAALRRYCPPEVRWTVPGGGLCIWVTLPHGLVSTDIYTEGIERGIGVTAGNVFFPQPPRQSYLRLCFASQPPEQIEQGIAILGQLISDHLRRRDRLAARACREMQPLM